MQKFFVCASFYALALIVAAEPARPMGTNSFSYLSAGGNDANDCAEPATPCQTISGAIGKTVSYGEIDCVSVQQPIVCVQHHSITQSLNR